MRTGRLVDPLAELPGVSVVRTDRVLSPVRASRVLRELDERERCDLLVLRGRKLVAQVVSDGHFDGRIWAYLTDIPQSAAEMTGEAAEELGRIAQACRHLLCQTEELRCFIEAWVPHGLRQERAVPAERAGPGLRAARA